MKSYYVKVVENEEGNKSYFLAMQDYSVHNVDEYSVLNKVDLALEDDFQLSHQVEINGKRANIVKRAFLDESSRVQGVLYDIIPMIEREVSRITIDQSLADEIFSKE